MLKSSHEHQPWLLLVICSLNPTKTGCPISEPVISLFILLYEPKTLPSSLGCQSKKTNCLIEVMNCPVYQLSLRKSFAVSFFLQIIYANLGGIH